MAWTMRLRLLESCRCAQVCPCILGPAKPDQEWCSGMFGMQITEGASDGVDLSGTKAVLHFELPGHFLGGIDKARLDAPGVTVEGIGQVRLEPIKGESGAPAVIDDAPLFGAFALSSEQLAFARDTRFPDPDTRGWESLGAGGIVPDLVEWSG